MKYFLNIFKYNFAQIWRTVGACWDLKRTESYYFPSSVSVCVSSWWVGLLGCLLTDMDEVARGLGLARDVCHEISVDTVLHFATEGLVQQSFEALQAMRVVGQTEFTGEDKQSKRTLE